MNSEESRFRELLNEPPFDGSYRKEHCEQLRQQLLEAFDASQADLARPRIRRTIPNLREIMSRPIPRIAAVALAMVTSCLVLGVMFRTRPTIAFDNLIGPILTAKTARFSTVIEGKDLPKGTFRTLVLEPNRLRQELPSGQIVISDSNLGSVMVLTPAQKSAILSHITDMPTRQKPANFFDDLRTNLGADSASSKREPLGRKQIAGREAIGFRVKQAHAEMTIWGDAETGLPIMVEMTIAMLPDAKITMTDFEFDVQLDEGLFKTEPPEGYSVQKLNVTSPAEKNVVTALKMLSDENGGQFPDRFDFTAVNTCITNWIQKHSGKPDAVRNKELVSETLPLTQGLMFAAMLPAESNARYAGRGIKRDDATSPVFWYKPVGAENYRVIYGDLSVKEQNVPPESPNAGPVTLSFAVSKTGESEKAKSSPSQPRIPKTRNVAITVTGSALDPDGHAIEGATVFLVATNGINKTLGTTTTDREGHYAFRDAQLPVPKPSGAGSLEQGSFEVLGKAAGRAFAFSGLKFLYVDPQFLDPKETGISKERGFFPGDKIELILTFPLPRQIGGRFIDEQEQPVSGAKVQLISCEHTKNGGKQRADAYEFYSLSEADKQIPEEVLATSDADGRFEFKSVPPEVMCRLFIKRLDDPTGKSLTAICSSTAVDPPTDYDGGPVIKQPIEMTLHSLRTIPVKVTLGDTDRPAARVRVGACQFRATGAGSYGTTDVNGNVTLKLPPGMYKLMIDPTAETGDNIATYRDLIVEEQNAPQPVTFKLTAGCILMLEAVDADTGAGILGVEFWEMDQQGHRGTFWTSTWQFDYARTNDRGQARAVVEPGTRRYGLGVRNPLPAGYEAADRMDQETGRELDLPAGKTVVAKFKLRRLQNGDQVDQKEREK